DDKSGGYGLGGGGLGAAPVSQAGVEFNLQNLETKVGFAKANISAINHSPESLNIEGYEVGPGTSVELEIEVAEPESDEYEMTLSLKVISYMGDTFYRHLQIPYNRGVALLARGFFEKAYEFYQDAIKKNPRHLDALLRKSEILIEWGLEEEAQAVINEILAINPDHAGAFNTLRQIADKKSEKESKKISDPEKRKIAGFPEILFDRYTPIRLLGKDAFASIILVIRNDTGDIRALKIAHEDVAIGSSLYTEVSMLYQLKHLNVLKMYRAEFNPTLFLELEYVSGVGCGGELCRTLADMKPPLPDNITYAMIEGIASGVAYFHSKGVRHYNLSPKYILLDEPMTPKISGLIHRSLIQSDKGREYTMIVRAPEQKHPEKYGKQGKRTDLFQMGAIWYWLMTGKMPYQHGSISDEGTGGIISGVYLPLSIVNPDYSEYDPLLRRLLALEKRDRYGSADEFLAELRGIKLNNDMFELYLSDEN
ncbi:MAG: protein kinase, partial [Methanobacteriota archaeon]